MSSTLHPARSLRAAIHRTSLAPLSSSLLSAQLPFCRHSSPATRRSCLSPLFVAFPYISRLSPLSTAFTYFDRGYGVQLSRPSAPFSPLVSSEVALRGGRSRATFWFDFIDLQTTSYATPLFSQPSELPGGGIPTLPGNVDPEWKQRTSARGHASYLQGRRLAVTVNRPSEHPP